MTVEEDEDEEKSGSSSSNSVILVAVKVGSKGHELLTWALVKAAQPADQVIALHVVTDSSELSLNGQGKTSEEIASVFNSAVEIYEGFCSLKQVDLQFKITHGSAMQNVLVNEAKRCGATQVILGARSQNNVSSSIALAKSCAKKLPFSTSVLVVENGKIVFRRHGVERISEKHHPPAIRFFTQMRLKFRRRSSKDFESCVGSSPAAAESFFHDTIISSTSSDGSTRNYKNFDQLSSSDDSKSSLENRDIGSEPRGSGSLSSCGSDHAEIPMPDDEGKDDSCTVGHEQGIDNSVNSRCTEKKQLTRGWSFLRAIVSLPKLPVIQSVVRRTSVIEWAMQIPRKHADVTVKVQLKRQACKACKLKEELQSSDEGLSDEFLSKKERFSCGHHYTPSREENSLAISVTEICEKKTCKQFTYQELKKATSSFAQENFIGRGGWSKVYKGLLPDGRYVAVKLLNPSPDAEQEVLSEIDILTTVSHRNIITLNGYCIEGINCLLVYDFICRGNLEQILQGREKPCLLWAERLKIAIGVAEALDYLHNKCSPCVIHGDVKSSNILISEDFEPRLSDFGLAKWAPTTSTHISCSDILGTFGYLAPEYFVSGEINDKTDVYAFGVVLLELMTGKKPIDSRKPNSRESLVMWARPLLHNGSIGDVVDQCLDGVYDYDEMQRMMLAASLCIRQSPQYRPGINQVVLLLKGKADLAELASCQSNPETEWRVSDEDMLTANQSHDLQNYLSMALLEADTETEPSINDTNHTEIVQEENANLGDHS